MKFLLVLIPFLFTLGCTPKQSCDIKKIVADKLAPGVSTALECKNLAQIQKDILSVLDKNSVCGVVPVGEVAQVICPIIVKGAVSLLGSQIPSNWECNPAMASAGVEVALTAACNLLPF